MTRTGYLTATALAAMAVSGAPAAQAQPAMQDGCEEQDIDRNNDGRVGACARAGRQRQSEPANRPDEPPSTEDAVRDLGQAAAGAIAGAIASELGGGDEDEPREQRPARREGRAQWHQAGGQYRVTENGCDWSPDAEVTVHRGGGRARDDTEIVHAQMIELDLQGNAPIRLEPTGERTAEGQWPDNPQIRVEMRLAGPDSFQVAGSGEGWSCTSRYQRARN